MTDNSFKSLVESLDVNFKKINKAFRVVEAKVYKREYSLKEAYIETCKEFNLSKLERNDLYEGLMDRFPIKEEIAQQPVVRNNSLDRYLRELGAKLWENLHKIASHSEAVLNPTYMKIFNVLHENESTLDAYEIFNKMYGADPTTGVEEFKQTLDHMCELGMIHKSKDGYSAKAQMHEEDDKKQSSFDYRHNLEAAADTLWWMMHDENGEESLKHFGRKMTQGDMYDSVAKRYDVNVEDLVEFMKKY